MHSPKQLSVCCTWLVLLHMLAHNARWLHAANQYKSQSHAKMQQKRRNTPTSPAGMPLIGIGAEPRPNPGPVTPSKVVPPL